MSGPGHVDGGVVHRAAAYVGNRDDLSDFHCGWDNDLPLGPEKRHGTAWTDSTAWTHCICFGAAVRAAEPLVEALRRIAEGDLPEHMSEGAFAEAVLRHQDVSGLDDISSADATKSVHLGPGPHGQETS